MSRIIISGWVLYHRVVIVDGERQLIGYNPLSTRFSIIIFAVLWTNNRTLSEYGDVRTCPLHILLFTGSWLWMSAMVQGSQHYAWSYPEHLVQQVFVIEASTTAQRAPGDVFYGGSSSDSRRLEYHSPTCQKPVRGV